MELSDEELSQLSIEKLIMLIPSPPSLPPVIKVDQRKPRGSFYDKGTAPRTSSVPVGNLSFDFQQLLSYASASELDADGKKYAFSMILSLSPNEMNEQLGKVYTTIMSSKGGEPKVEKKEKKDKKDKKEKKNSVEKTGSPLKKSGSFKSMGFSFSKAIKRSNEVERVTFVPPSNSFLNFGLKESLCPLNEDMVEDILISCKVGKSKFQVKLPPPSHTYSLSVSPESGILRKGKEVALKVTLNIKSTIHLEEVFTIEILGFGRLFFAMSLQSERSVFGEDIRQYFEKGVVKIPPVLDILKCYFESNGGLKKEKIFINTGNDEDILLTRDQLNRDTFTECRDIYAIPTLILSWFRELPQPLLSSISESLLISATGEYECLSVLDMLKEPQKSIFRWVLELLADCQLASEAHGVDIKQLASIFAVVLYTPSSADPVKNEKLMSKLENLILQLVNYRLKLRS